MKGSLFAYLFSPISKGAAHIYSVLIKPLRVKYFKKLIAWHYHLQDLIDLKGYPEQKEEKTKLAHGRMLKRSK